MSVILKCLLYLILVGDVLVLLALVASFIFGVSFGVRVANGNVFRALSQRELTTVFVITVIVAFVSLVLLNRLRLR